MLGFALRTKSTPDVKEAYGKSKKEDSVNDDDKRSNVQFASTKQKPLVVKFNNVAFVEEHPGDRFWFFRTHVIPGTACNNVIFKYNFI